MVVIIVLILDSWHIFDSRRSPPRDKNSVVSPLPSSHMESLTPTITKQWWTPSDSQGIQKIMIYLYSGWRRLDRAINIFLETWKLPVRDNLILNFVDYCIRGLAFKLGMLFCKLPTQSHLKHFSHFSSWNPHQRSKHLERILIVQSWLFSRLRNQIRRVYRRSNMRKFKRLAALTPLVWCYSNWYSLNHGYNPTPTS